MNKILFAVMFLIPGFLFGQELKIGDCFLHKASGIQYCFAADSSTYDTLLGDSYRLLLISKVEGARELARHYLKINLASDFGYEFLTEYLEAYKLLVIQGAQAFYLYHTETGMLSDYIKPDHKDCAFSDNQGTYISDLKIGAKGSIVQLKVKECGTRYFDISDIEHIVEICEKKEREWETL